MQIYRGRATLGWEEMHAERRVYVMWREVEGVEVFGDTTGMGVKIGKLEDKELGKGRWLKKRGLKRGEET